MNKYRMIKCNNCDAEFDNDEELEQQEDDRGFYLGCNNCYTDAFLMEISCE